jgi:sec-independent protein translocase protein TatB
VRAEVERELEIEEIRRVAREAAAQAEAAQAKLDQAQAQINAAVGKAQGAASADVASVLQSEGTPPADHTPQDGLMTGPSPDDRRIEKTTDAPMAAPVAPAESDEVPRGHT